MKATKNVTKRTKQVSEPSMIKFTMNRTIHSIVKLKL